MSSEIYISKAALISYLVCTAFGTVFIVLFLIRRIKKATRVTVILKTFASLCFIMAWLVSAVTKLDMFAICIGCGLTFGLSGDIFLDLKYCDLKYDRLFTILGILAFATGHIFYNIAVINGNISGFVLPAFIPAFVIGIAAFLFIYFGEKLMKLNYNGLKLLASFYGGLLAFTAAFSLSSCLVSGINGNLNILTMGIGTVLFVISDLILSGTYFGTDKDKPIHIITNHVTYYLAQFIIAASVLF